MGRKLLLINFVLLAGVALLGDRFRTEWENYQTTRETRWRLLRTIDDLEVPSPLPEPGAPLPTSAFLVVAERDLFSPDRGLSEDESMSNVDPTAPELIEPKLLGVSTINELRKASITEFANKRDKQGSPRVVRVGDEIQGYRVEEILSDSMILAWNEVQREILLDRTAKAAEKKAPKGKLAVTVLRIGSAAAAVETTAPEAEESRGVEVVQAASPTRAGQPGVGAAAGPNGRAGQGGARPGVGSSRGRPGSQTGTLGIPSRGRPTNNQRQ